ncbi:MAG: alcohol dehydrogenase catalytic domain-containing protein [Spirochaetia bacterium]|jgi:L-iditol 2-dehydrogenase
MRAFVYEEAGIFHLSRDLPRPQVHEDTAVIKVLACSVCGTDLRAWQHGDERISPPRIMGHEVCGEIVEMGAKRKGFAIGERVSLAPAIGCGVCFSCSRGHPNLCDDLRTIGFQYDGGFAEYMEIPALAFDRANVYHTAAGVSDEEAALVEPIACVVNGQESLHIELGDSVAIFGSGFIGCMHAELARMKGASPIILIEPNGSRARAAHALIPFCSLIISSQMDLHKEVRRLTGGKGVDVLVTACPVGQAQKDAIALAAKRGRVSLFGGLAKDTSGFLDSNMIHYKELAIHGAHASTPFQNKEVMGWVEARKLDVKKYVTRVYPLEETENAFRDLQSQSVFKAVIKPDSFSR